MTQHARSPQHIRHGFVGINVSDPSGTTPFSASSTHRTIDMMSQAEAAALVEPEEDEDTEQDTDPED